MNNDKNITEMKVLKITAFRVIAQPRVTDLVPPNTEMEVAKIVEERNVIAEASAELQESHNSQAAMMTEEKAASKTKSCSSSKKRTIDQISGGTEKVATPSKTRKLADGQFVQASQISVKEVTEELANVTLETATTDTVEALTTEAIAEVPAAEIAEAPAAEVLEAPIEEKCADACVTAEPEITEERQPEIFFECVPAEPTAEEVAPVSDVITDVKVEEVSAVNEDHAVKSVEAPVESPAE
jgi:hypothetical protein